MGFFGYELQLSPHLNFFRKIRFFFSSLEIFRFTLKHRNLKTHFSPYTSDMFRCTWNEVQYLRVSTTPLSQTVLAYPDVPEPVLLSRRRKGAYFTEIFAHHYVNLVLSVQQLRSEEIRQHSKGSLPSLIHQPLTSDIFFPVHLIRPNMEMCKKTSPCFTAPSIYLIL